jgi:hypothetical protein
MLSHSLLFLSQSQSQTAFPDAHLLAHLLASNMTKDTLKKLKAAIVAARVEVKNNTEHVAYLKKTCHDLRRQADALFERAEHLRLRVVTQQQRELDDLTDRHRQLKMLKAANRAPRRQSPYNAFISRNQARFRAEHPEATQPELVTLMGAAWKVLPHDQRLAYDVLREEQMQLTE